MVLAMVLIARTTEFNQRFNVSDKRPGNKAERLVAHHGRCGLIYEAHRRVNRPVQPLLIKSNPNLTI